MKTLHIDTGRRMHGGQWQVVYLLERLEGAVLLARGPLLEEARRRGIDARPLSLLTLARFARKFDLLHAHDSRAHTLALFADGFARSAPLIVSRRVGFPVNSRWKYARAQLYLAVSKFVAGRLQEGGVPAEKIRVIYDGVPVPRRPSEADGGVVALANKCSAVVQALGIPVQFTSDLWRDLSAAKIFVYVSELEGLGSAALAAMASGVPVIASRVGGLPEVVEHGRTGLLIETGELGPAIRRLLNDPVEAQEMGRRGRELVKEKFSAETMTEATLRAYREVLAC